MDDVISRQAAKLKVARVIWEDGDSCNDFHDKCVDCIDDVPSAQTDLSGYSDRLWKAAYERGKAEALAERKKGKWIKHIDDLFPAESTIECSMCHHEQPLTIDDSFCPNCGADMRGEQDEGD